MMHRLTLAAAMFAAGCVTAPQQQAAADGQDEMIAQQSFCGVIFSGFASAAENQEDRKMLQKMRDVTVVNVAMLTGGDRYNKTAVDSERIATAYVFGADDHELVAAGERCVALLTEGE